MTLLLVVDLIPAPLWAQIKALLGQAGPPPVGNLGEILDFFHFALAFQTNITYILGT
jgi:hypothetical protein